MVEGGPKSLLKKVAFELRPGEDKELARKELGKHVLEDGTSGYPGPEAGVILECPRNRKKVSGWNAARGEWGRSGVGADEAGEACGAGAVGLELSQLSEQIIFPPLRS